MNIICVSTKAFNLKPSDDDWKKATPIGGGAVEPVGKLTTMWGAIKSSF